VSLTKLVILAAIAGLALLSSAPVASATAIRTDPGNGVLTSGSLVTTTSEGLSTFTSSIGTITCGDAFVTGHVGTNPATPTVTGSITIGTGVGCVDTVPFIDFDDCQEASPFPIVKATANATGGGHITLNNMFLRCHIVGSGSPGSACYFKAITATGAFANANSTLSFTSVPVLHSVPPTNTGDQGALCPNGSLTTNFANVHAANGNRITLTTS
jgi:hypothetical protein